MRNAFAKAIAELGDTRDDLVLLAGSIGIGYSTSSRRSTRLAATIAASRKQT